MKELCKNGKIITLQLMISTTIYLKKCELFNLI